MNRQNVWLQIKTFFRIGVEYDRRPAYAIRLDRVPGLSITEQAQIKGFISQHKEFGTNAVPWRFQSITQPPPGKKVYILLPSTLL